MISNLHNCYNISPNSNDSLPGDIQVIGTCPENQYVQPIWVHKLVIWNGLSAIKNDIANHNQLLIPLSVDVDHRHLAIILQYLYGINVDIGLGSLIGIAESATKLGVSSFVEQKLGILIMSLIKDERDREMRESLLLRFIELDSPMNRIIIRFLCNDPDSFELINELLKNRDVEVPLVLRAIIVSTSKRNKEEVRIPKTSYNIHQGKKPYER